METPLRIELDDEAFDRIYGFALHPVPYRAGKRVAVRGQPVRRGIEGAQSQFRTPVNFCPMR